MARSPKANPKAMPPGNVRPPSWYYYVLARIPRRREEDFKLAFLKDADKLAPPADIIAKCAEASQWRLDHGEMVKAGRGADAEARQLLGKLSALEDEVMAWIDTTHWRR